MEKDCPRCSITINKDSIVIPMPTGWKFVRVGYPFFNDHYLHQNGLSGDITIAKRTCDNDYIVEHMLYIIVERVIKIAKESFRAEKGQIYWAVVEDSMGSLEAFEFIENFEDVDNKRYESGNYFKYQHETKPVLEEIRRAFDRRRN